MSSPANTHVIPLTKNKMLARTPTKIIPECSQKAFTPSATTSARTKTWPATTETTLHRGDCINTSAKKGAVYNRSITSAPKNLMYTSFHFFCFVHYPVITPANPILSSDRLHRFFSPLSHGLGGSSWVFFHYFWVLSPSWRDFRLNVLEGAPHHCLSLFCTW